MQPPYDQFETGATKVVKLPFAIDCTCNLCVFQDMVPDQGVWILTLDKISDPGPFTITASLKSYNNLILQNVVFGDVWVCSGQSNMKFTMGQVCLLLELKLTSQAAA